VDREVGRTPRSARVPLDPLFAFPEKADRRSAADQGVRPTLEVKWTAS
jgi:hypothetical protein